jgi:hypothetical protein
LRSLIKVRMSSESSCGSVGDMVEDKVRSANAANLALAHPKEPCNFYDLPKKFKTCLVVFQL